jgi:hypothetical protein
MLCTWEALLGRDIDTVMSCLYSFTLDGKVVDKCIIAGWYSESEYTSTQFSCIFLDKNLFRVYFYEMIDEKKDDDFHATVYYIEYHIAKSGIMNKKYKSDITCLKKYPDFYSEYNPQNEDDPLNAYDF